MKSAPRSTRGVALLVPLVPLAATIASCHARPTASECEAMLDRYLDMTIAADPTIAPMPPAQSEVARAMKKATKRSDESYKKVAAQCQREVSRGEYDCAMKAPTPNDWEACIE
jgi:hypothetical protein